MNIVSDIWIFITAVIGSIAVIAGIISAVIYLAEKASLRRTRAQKTWRIPQTSGIRLIHRVALITGASSGLGAEFARQIDRHPEKYDVNEIWLLARRGDRLEKLADELRIATRVLAVDMTDDAALEGLRLQCEELDKDSDFSIVMLVNCAGFGKSGNSRYVGAEQEAAMVRLNDEAAVKITQFCLPFMRKGARIAEICSVAGFQPIPGLNVYSASKAFLYSYSRALRIELIPSGISVTAVCPYWVRDTEFISVATGEAKHPFLSCRTEKVVTRALSSLRRHHAVSTPSLVSTVDRLFCGLIPDALLARICGLFSLR